MAGYGPLKDRQQLGCLGDLFGARSTRDQTFRLNAAPSTGACIVVLECAEFVGYLGVWPIEA